VKRTLEVMRAAAWLGWQIEANWADPFLFFVYSVVKPLSTTLILFIMVRVVSQGHATADTFLFLFLGNTFFLYVSEVLIGISWAVFRDREDYETLKYIYTAPLRLLPYLLGRGATKMATATIGVVVALLFGRFVLGIPIGGPGTSWGLLVLVTALGLDGMQLGSATKPTIALWMT
jgi:ABC-2 type transport system permease protein